GSQPTKTANIKELSTSWLNRPTLVTRAAIVVFLNFSNRSPIPSRSCYPIQPVATPRRLADFQLFCMQFDSRCGDGSSTIPPQSSAVDGDTLRRLLARRSKDAAP